MKKLRVPFTDLGLTPCARETRLGPASPVFKGTVILKQQTERNCKAMPEVAEVAAGSDPANCVADVSIRRSRRAVACPEAGPPISSAILVKLRLVFTEIKIRHLGFVGFNRLGGI